MRTFQCQPLAKEQAFGRPPLAEGRGPCSACLGPLPWAQSLTAVSSLSPPHTALFGFICGSRTFHSLACMSDTPHVT